MRRFAPLVVATLLFASPVAAAATSAPVQDAAREAALAEERSALISELAALLELGLARDAVASGLPAVSAGGLLELDGRGIALVSRALFDTGRDAEGERLLVGARATANTAAWVELEWVRVELLRDRLDQAAARLLRPDGSLRLANLAEAWMLAARVRARQSDLPGAVPYLRGFIERAPFHPDTVTACHLLQLEAAQRGDVEAAAALRGEADRRRRIFEVVRARALQVRAHPEDPLPRHGLALALMELGDFGTAAIVLQELLRFHPDYVRAWFQLGECLRRTGRSESAVDAYSEGLKRDGDDHKSRLNRALVLIELGRHGAARPDLELLLRSPLADDPLYIGIYIGLARCYRAAGDEPAAEQAYAKYRSLGGTDPLDAAAAGGSDR